MGFTEKARTFAHTIVRDAKHFLDGPLYSEPLKPTPIRIAMIAMSPELQLVVRFRVYSALYAAGHRKAAHWLYLRTKKAHHCDIHAAARVGPGLRIGHASDIIIGPDVSVGADAVIFNGVTLGNRLRRDGAWGMPTVGEGVIIGTGAKVLGAIDIGDGARIGANAVVLQAVPAGATAVGNPARVTNGVAAVRPSPIRMRSGSD